jgi:chromosome segregation ATPase
MYIYDKIFQDKFKKIFFLLIISLVMTALLLTLTSCGNSPLDSSHFANFEQQSNALIAATTEKVKADQKQFYEKKLEEKIEEIKAGLNVDQVESVAVFKERLEKSPKAQLVSEAQLKKNEKMRAKLVESFQLKIKPLDDELASIKKEMLATRKKIKEETSDLQQDIKEHTNAIKELKEKVLNLTLPLQKTLDKLEETKEKITIKRDLAVAEFEKELDKFELLDYKHDR